MLPALALAMSGLGQAARLTRANMIESTTSPISRWRGPTAFPPWRIATRYAFRPAFIPTLTILGLEFAAMLGNAFLVEKVFGWPGLSRYGVEVIIRKDLDAIVGTVLIIAAAFLIMNIVVDMLVGFINPRIRLAAGEAEHVGTRFARAAGNAAPRPGRLFAQPALGRRSRHRRGDRAACRSSPTS